MIRHPPRSTLFPTRRSSDLEKEISHHRQGRSRNGQVGHSAKRHRRASLERSGGLPRNRLGRLYGDAPQDRWSQGGESVQVLRSEEHTSELQSLTNLVCRLLL